MFNYLKINFRQFFLLSPSLLSNTLTLILKKLNLRLYLLNILSQRLFNFDRPPSPIILMKVERKSRAVNHCRLGLGFPFVGRLIKVLLPARTPQHYKTKTLSVEPNFRSGLLKRFEPILYWLNFFNAISIANLKFLSSIFKTSLKMI